MRQNPEAALHELLVAHQVFFQSNDSVDSVSESVQHHYIALLWALAGALPEAARADFPVRILFARGRECLPKIVHWTYQSDSPSPVIGLVGQFGSCEALFTAAAPRFSARLAESVRWTEMPQLVSLCDAKLAISALDAVSDFRKLPALIQCASECAGPDSGLPKSVAVVLLSLFVLAVVLTIPLLRKHLANASAEFQKLASRYADRPWAEKLLRQGTRSNWMVAKAWHSANLSEDEKAEAVDALSALMADQGFALIQPESGADYDERKMQLASGKEGSLRRRYVWKLQRPGLRQDSTVIEHALVEAGSAERIALWRSHDLLATRKYLDRYRSKYPTRPNLDMDHQLDSACLNDVVTSIASDEEVDAWLQALVDKAPGEALGFVVNRLGTLFLDDEMVSSENLLHRKTATVQKIIHRGLRRSDGTLLLRAHVEAQDSDNDI